MTVASPSLWTQIKDGDHRAREIFRRHYSYRRGRDQISLFWEKNRNYSLFVGPGEKFVMLSSCERALFVWRKFRSMNHQQGINCAVFRNEGAGLSSDLIRSADQMAWEHWPDSRHYTYVNADRVKSSNPGYCFIAAGWLPCGYTKSGLRILEIFREAS